MSDCNVCFFAGEADGFCEVWNRHIVKKSRKEFRCGECRRVIPIGSQYEQTFTVFEGDAVTYRTCMVCVEIRDTFHCGEDRNQPLIGELWDNIGESGFYESLSEGCIWKLKSTEAMEYLRTRANRYRTARGLPTL